MSCSAQEALPSANPFPSNPDADPPQAHQHVCACDALSRVPNALHQPQADELAGVALAVTAELEQSETVKAPYCTVVFWVV